MQQLSPTTHEVAALLDHIGWRSHADAQWTQLDEAIRDGRLVSALFSAERNLREITEAQP
jgi:hypothetical protein